MVLSEAESGEYFMSIAIEAPDGQVMRAGGTFKPDGTAVRVTNSMDVDVISMSMPNLRTLVMGAGFQGHPTSTRVWTLSEDGEEMVEIAIRHLPDGTPYVRKAYWKRNEKGRVISHPPLNRLEACPHFLEIRNVPI